MSAISRHKRPIADNGAVRTFPAILGLGAGLAVVEAAFDYTGGSLWGWKQNSERDEYEHKEMLRTTRRRPLQETLEQLGEGRGMSGRILFRHSDAYWSCRYLRSWLRREKGATNKGESRNRRSSLCLLIASDGGTLSYIEGDMSDLKDLQSPS